MKFPWYEVVVQKPILSSLNGSFDDSIRGSYTEARKGAG